MKSVLFAINMEGLSTNQIEPFENRVISALKSGSKEYAQVQPYHCDYKESVLRMCSQYDIDVVVINEKLQGRGEIQTIITCTGLDEFVNNRFEIDKVFQIENGKIIGSSNS